MNTAPATYVIRGAMVVDGSGSPPRRLDVSIRGGRIAAVAPRLSEAAARVIDADGLVLAPGFIDIHGHSDMSLFRFPGAESKLFQGVTVEVTGNCGLSAFPVDPGRETELAEYLAVHDFALPASPLPWSDFRTYADHLDSLGLGLNLAPLVGHASMRIAVMGMDNRAPSDFELAALQRMLAEALEQGAWGMSTGLIYPPGSYAATDELIVLARSVAGCGGFCSSHIRNESGGLLAALDEAIEIARESGVRMQVSHLKALGRSNRGRGKELLAVLAAARQTGVDIAADQYPYDASATSLTAVLPQWALDGGIASLLRRLGEPALAGQLKQEIGREMSKREGAARIIVTCRSQRNREISGRSIAEIAEAWRCPPEEVVTRLVLEEQGEVGAIFFSMCEEDVDAILSDPLVAVGSDGHGFDAARACGEATHPRSYGCFPRVLGRYVRERNLLALSTAVLKMTGLPASRIGFTDRGLVRPGFVADIVLFDPEAIQDPSDYADPHRYAVGIVHLFMDGRPVIAEGKLTGLRPGRVLRRVKGAKK